MKNTTHYSASDIQRYLNGEMSAREMFEMEKAALEDPFLADALEGYEAHPTAADDVNELHTRLNTRVTNPGKVRLFQPWMRVAAAIILLIGLGFGAWYFLLNTNKPEQAALVEHKVAPQTQQQPQAPAPAAAADSTTITLAAPPVATTTPSLKKAKVASPAKPDSFTSAYVRVAPPAAAIKPLADSIQYNVAGAAADLVATDKKVSAPSAAREFHSNVLAPRVLSGRVLDFNNNPLSGATLHLAGNNGFATVTDMHGNFSMKIEPISTKDSVLRVNIGMVGYESSSLAFNTFDPGAATGNLIYLKQQSNSLDEVVVIGYGSKRKETRALISSPSDEKIDSLWISAMPVSGRQAYLDYLAKGKTTIGADSTIRGTVVVSFDISRKGALSSFKVERSLTPAHDAGIIRLVSEGPQWKVSKNRPVRAAVRVTF